MREIKFRGKRIDTGEWVHGDLIHERYGTCIQFITTINSQGAGAPERKPTTERHKVTVDPATVGQYTGLKDKNGVEIYEGDIISFAVFDYNDIDTHYTGVVKWCGSRFMIWHNNDSEYYGTDGGFDLDWVLAQYDETEVIGNIYDNPELLEQSSC